MKKFMILAASLVLSASAMAQTVVIRDNDHRDNRAVVVHDRDRGHYNDRHYDNRHNDRDVVVKEVRKVDDRGNVVVKEVRKVTVNDNHHPRAAHRFTNQELRHLRKHARYMGPREERQHERMHRLGIRHDHRNGY